MNEISINIPLGLLFAVLGAAGGEGSYTYYLIF